MNIVRPCHPPRIKSRINQASRLEIAQKRTYTGCNGYVRGISLNTCKSAPQDSLDLIVAVSDDGHSRTWPTMSVADLSDSAVQTTHMDSVLAADLRNNILATGSKDFHIHIIDLPEHQRAAAASRKHTAAVDAIGRYNIRTSSVVRSLVVRSESCFLLDGPISDCAALQSQLSDDGTILLAGGGDGVLRSWQRRAVEPTGPNAPSSTWVSILDCHTIHTSAVFKIVRFSFQSND